MPKDIDMELVKRLYVEKCISSDAIGEVTGVTGGTILRKLHALGICRNRQDNRLSRNGHWKGGTVTRKGYVYVMRKATRELTTRAMSSGR